MRRAADEVAIGLAQHRDLAAVRALIVAGLTQRWGDYRHSMNPDLEAFERTYSGASVIVATRDGEVVGCGILVAEAPGVARIVRMSVAADLQRTGIGGNVLRALLERAVSLGYSEVVLETSARLAFGRQLLHASRIHAHRAARRRSALSFRSRADSRMIEPRVERGTRHVAADLWDFAITVAARRRRSIRRKHSWCEGCTSTRAIRCTSACCA